MRLTHRPVPHALSQAFGSNATAGIAPAQHGTPAQRLVYLFGNYQPVGHLACDFGCPSGTPVAAAAAGLVVYAGPSQNMPSDIAAKYGYIFRSPDSGNIVVLESGDNSATAYSHNSEVRVQAGQRVAGGQTLALSGATGRVDGAHLHFEYMTLPINYGSPYYSRLDPMAQYGGASIITAGTTLEEEDDMASPEVISLLEDIASRVSKTNETVKAEGLATRKDIATVHNTIIKDVGSQLGNIQKGVNQKVDVDSLALELAGKLETRDLQALAQKLTVTVKEQ